MNKLFIYYSRTGNGDLIADLLKEKNYDIRKVIPKRQLPKSFFLSMCVGGMLGGLKHKAKLKKFDYDISKYDEIVIGTPVWNGNFACPINTLLSKIKLNDKKVSFIIYSGGGDAPNAVEEAAIYSDNIIQIQEPKKNKNIKEILKKI